MSGVSVACGNMGVSMLLIPAGAGELASEKKETTYPEATEPGTTEPTPKGSDTKEPTVKETANQKKIEATNPVKKETTSKATTLINQASVDGFIVYSVAKDDPYLAAVTNRNLPTVICDQPTDQPELNYVGIDDKQAIQPVVRKLTDAGHRKIGILCIRLDRQPNNGPVSAERLNNAAMHVQRSRIEGVLEVLAEVEVERADVPIVERHINDATNNRSAAKELLDKHPEITAVVCTVDNMALAVAELAADRGWNIPEQLSVTGFDGIPKAVELGITTVRQPSKDKGLTSGSVLAALIAHGSGRDAPRRILLETTVIEGNSVGAPRVGAL
ncbi:substrate-binding domain-containing protein [Corynebacterium sp. 4HC-13]|uniref:Substrate-binding domain-containing protein n=2 Tax=Corynebacterium anserum TaxID=2684406 RepID=A0A7G7YQT8_9CORY|nr:substrate-binding domain-containing protein [Corynebacterium anserum]QNH96858.1 substrate-binding domain-containing protein [Corynebacterium anserum]